MLLQLSKLDEIASRSNDISRLHYLKKKLYYIERQRTLVQTHKRERLVAAAAAVIKALHLPVCSKGAAY